MGELHTGDVDQPGVSRLSARGDGHQRRLARAVLADNGVHLTRANVEGDLRQRLDTGDCLGYRGEGQRADVSVRAARHVARLGQVNDFRMLRHARNLPGVW